MIPILIGMEIIDKNSIMSTHDPIFAAPCDSDFLLKKATSFMLFCNITRLVISDSKDASGKLGEKRTMNPS